MEETIAACLDLFSTEWLYLPDLGARVVAGPRVSVMAGPRACHLDQTKSGQPYQFDIFERNISPCQGAFVKALSNKQIHEGVY